ncbi:MAG: hypothetical protein FD139_48 [Methylocystaceae bacterium]|nr:MAG: hypothetical protein FD148_528 [Methylocystaceae bacterium]KAF0208601.1 MAG: hypothetical protein FD172_3417 [Methylocystaceae bacterium]TXT48438.1 MAG: hypothetical protein FD139_48 [Methylocystaceae bacterium]
MSITRDIASHENAVAYGGLTDAIGGVVTIVLVICGLVGISPPMMVAIATIVFGVALLIQGGAMLSEYAQIVFPGGVRSAMPEQMGGNSLALIFLVGAGGIVLGIPSLLGINTALLSPIAIIGFGTALLLGSNAVWRLYVLRRNSALMDTSVAQSQHVGAEMLASEMASGSAGIQALAGLAAIVLGILALAGSPADLTLNLVALLALGATLVLTGSTLSATVLSFMRT